MISAPWHKPFRGMQINKMHPLARGLVGCWLLNEGAGTRVFDSSGNGNDGDIINAVWVPDGLEFPGTFGKRVDVGNGKSLDIINQITTVAIINTNTITATSNILIGKFDGTSSADDSFFFRTDVANVQLYLRSSDGLSWTSAAKGGLPLKTNCFVAGTYDGKNIITYIDGIAGTPTAHTDTIRSNPTEDVSIGANSTSANVFNGCIFYAMIYNRALSPAEITWLHREPYAMFQQPVSPASLYYEAAVGAIAPTSTILGPLWGALAGPVG